MSFDVLNNRAFLPYKISKVIANFLSDTKMITMWRLSIFTLLIVYLYQYFPRIISLRRLRWVTENHLPISMLLLLYRMVFKYSTVSLVFHIVERVHQHCHRFSNNRLPQLYRHGVHVTTKRLTLSLLYSYSLTPCLSR